MKGNMSLADLLEALYYLLYESDYDLSRDEIVAMKDTIESIGGIAIHGRTQVYQVEDV